MALNGGAFTLGLAIATPIMMLSGFQLRTILATDSTNQFAYRDYFGVRIVTTIVAVVLITLLAIGLQYRTSILVTVVMVTIIKAVDTLSDIQYGLFQKNERMSSMAKSMVANGAISASLFMLVMLVSDDLNVALAGSVAGSLGVLLFYNLPECHRIMASLHPHLCKEELETMLRPAWQPTIVRSMLVLAAPLDL